MEMESHMNLSTEASLPRPEFPRPDFERATWMNLNGEWGFAFDDADEGLPDRWFETGLPAERSRKILVPFCYQSPASGIGETAVHEIVWYSRSFSLPERFRGRRTILKFGAVDWGAMVYVNGRLATEHEGGYSPFSVDITRFLREGENRLTIRARDADDPVQPRGKQSWRGQGFGCWYTPTTGIWQTVWIEAVDAISIERYRAVADVHDKSVRLEVELDGFKPGLELRASARLEGGAEMSAAAAVSSRSPRLCLVLDSLDELDSDWVWRPGNPSLFGLELELVEAPPAAGGPSILDSVRGYFAFRSVESVGGQVLLNGVPIVQKLVLDQGYWGDSLLTPPSDEAIRLDIELAMSFGFNGARKHQKIEDPRYYYWADKLGFLVWGELPSNYGFAPEGMRALYSTFLDFVDRDYNHPSIVAWVPLNESWGVPRILVDARQQAFARALCAFAKAYDGTRLVSSNDGWEQVDGDLCAIHDYEASGEAFAEKISDWPAYLSGKSDCRLIYARGFAHRGEPVLLTEYGGIAFSGGAQGEWGYHGTVSGEDEFLSRFRSMTRAVLDSGRFAGFCYTQLTDVQQEINGLCSADRLPKVSPAAVQAILEA
jgi:beta-galactosidase/beta-glucuronidase